MRLRFAALLVPFLAALAFPSCSNEGEGQPCSQLAGNSGNDDCASGLVCTQVSNAQGARCCPSDRTTAKTPECSLSSSSGDGGNPNPPDSSTETGTGDSAVEGSSSDSAAEASSGDDASDGATADAGTDAASDSGTDAAGD